MANEPKKPDFSNVQGGARSSAPPAAPKADFGNVRSGAASTAPTITDTDVSKAKTYTVVKGDSLSKIAKREYGNANRWRAIFEALGSDSDLARRYWRLLAAIVNR